MTKPVFGQPIAARDIERLVGGPQEFTRLCEAVIASSLGEAVGSYAVPRITELSTILMEGQRFIQSSDRVLQVSGLPYVGKTRTVLEALRPEAGRVAWASYPEALTEDHFRDLDSVSRTILVVDHGEGEILDRMTRGPAVLFPCSRRTSSASDKTMPRNSFGTAISEGKLFLTWIFQINSESFGKRTLPIGAVADSILTPMQEGFLAGFFQAGGLRSGFIYLAERHFPPTTFSTGIRMTSIFLSGIRMP